MNGKEQVWDQVEAFRVRYLVGQLAHLPVDVFTLAEIEFKLDIIPFDDLYEKYEVDAALIQDFSGLYVDAEAYVIWEKGPRWKQRRLRFSVAHELGHFILHREVAAGLEFKTIEHFASWSHWRASRPPSTSSPLVPRTYSPIGSPAPTSATASPTAPAPFSKSTPRSLKPASTGKASGPLPNSAAATVRILDFS